MDETRTEEEREEGEREVGRFKRSITGTYIDTSNKSLLEAYVNEIKELNLIGGRSKMTITENVEFKVRCKYLLVRGNERYWQSMCKPRGCRPVKITALK